MWLTHAGIDATVLEPNGFDLESTLAGDRDLGVAAPLPPRVVHHVPLGPHDLGPENLERCEK